MAIHWARPLLKDILPAEVFDKLATIACNPVAGIHSGDYPIINGETGDLITGVPYKDGLRVPRSRMRTMCAEGIDVQVSYCWGHGTNPTVSRDLLSRSHRARKTSYLSHPPR